jgi:ribosomal protein L12E/L44/L45/RPP1/RPP2
MDAFMETFADKVVARPLGFFPEPPEEADDDDDDEDEDEEEEEDDDSRDSDADDIGDGGDVVQKV